MEQLKRVDQEVSGVFSELWIDLVTFLPSLVAGLLVLVVGVFVARLARRLTENVCVRLGLGGVGDRLGVTEMISRTGIAGSLPGLAAWLVYIFVLLGAVLASADIVGLNNVSQTIRSLVLFVPKVVASGAVFLIGLWLAGVVQKGAQSSAETMGMESARAVATLCKAAVILISIPLAISQLSIDVTVINYLILALLVALSVAVAISFGLGTRDYSREIVAGVYVKELFSVGASVRVRDVEGVIAGFTAVAVIIEGESGVTTVPNSWLLKAPVTRRM